MGWMPDKSLNPSTIYSNHLMNLSEQTIGKPLSLSLTVSVTATLTVIITVIVTVTDWHCTALDPFLTHDMILKCDEI